MTTTIKMPNSGGRASGKTYLINSHMRLRAISLQKERLMRTTTVKARMKPTFEDALRQFDKVKLEALGIGKL